MLLTNLPLNRICQPQLDCCNLQCLFIFVISIYCLSSGGNILSRHKTKKTDTYATPNTYHLALPFGGQSTGCPIDHKFALELQGCGMYHSYMARQISLNKPGLNNFSDLPC